MKIDTLIWLLPIIFMLHDFEEIVMIRPWLARNRARLELRFPPRLNRLIHTTGDLSTSAFALMVAGIFTVIALITYLAVEEQWYAIWAGMLIVFFVHALVHIGQWIVYRAYVPVVLTSLPATGYSLYAFYRLAPFGFFNWGSAAVWAAFWLMVVVAALPLFIRLAARFDRWLSCAYAGQG